MAGKSGTSKGTTRAPAPAQAPRPPATPAPGSSPITPPSGSAPLQGRSMAPTRAAPTVAPVAAPARAPGMASMAPAETPQAQANPMQGRAVAAQRGVPIRPGVAPTQLAQTYLRGAGVNTEALQRDLGSALAGASLALGIPQAMGRPDAGVSERTLRDLTVGNVRRVNDWFNEAGARVQAPETSTYSAPATNVTVEKNEYGEDWVYQGPTGETQRAPKTRVNNPSLPVKTARALGEVLGGALNVLTAPAQMVERIAGAANIELGQTRLSDAVVLPGGRVFGTNRTGAAGQVTKAGLPGNLGWIAGNVLQPATGATLRDAAYELYGDTPEVRQALSDATALAFSRPEDQLTAVARMVEFGESPDSAIYGDGEYITKTLSTLGYFDDPLKAIKADPLANYVYETLKAQGRSDADIVKLFDARGLPGEADLGLELIGQALIDPLNHVDDVARPIMYAMREQRALRWFAPSNRTVGDVLELARRTYNPYDVQVLNALDPLAKTPTAVAFDLAQKGNDAVLMVLQTAMQTAGKATETGKRLPTAEATFRAFLALAEEAPLRPDFGDDESFFLARKAWEGGQLMAQRVLGHIPVAFSDAGKIGAAITRELLADDLGRVNPKAISGLIEGAENAYVALEKLMGRYQEVAAKLLARSTRQGVDTIGEFVALGNRAQDFRTFERGAAGAVEAVGLERNAAQLGLDYKATPLQHTAAAFTAAQAKINSALWGVFARFNPGYAFRNAANNLVTALADSAFDASLTGEKTRAILDLVGNPSASHQAISRIGENVGTNDFAGSLRVGNVPLGAQAIESAFSERIVATEARKALDRLFQVGKAIPQLPPTVARELGPELEQLLYQRLRHTNGDIDAALRWLYDFLGTNTVPRSIPADSFDAVRRSDLGDELTDMLHAALKTSSTPEDWAREMTRIRGFVQDALGKADDAIPDIANVFDDASEQIALDLQMAERAGLTPEQLVAYTPPMPETAQFDAVPGAPGALPPPAVAAGDDAPVLNGVFDQQLRIDREITDRARSVAEATGRNAKTPEEFAQWRDEYMRVQAEVNRLSEGTRKAHDVLRAEVWKRTEQLRAIAAGVKRGEIIDQVVKSVKVGGRMLEDLWRNYFKQRDELWKAFRVQAEGKWIDFSNAHGVTYSADPIRTIEQAEDAANAAARADVLADVTPNVEFGRKNLDELRIDVQIGTVEGKNIVARQGAGGGWVEYKRFKPLSAKEKAAGWRVMPRHEVDLWVEDFAERVYGTRDVTWEQIVNDVLAEARGGGARRAPVPPAAVSAAPVPPNAAPVPVSAAAVPPPPPSNIDEVVAGVDAPNPAGYQNPNGIFAPEQPRVAQSVLDPQATAVMNPVNAPVARRVPERFTPADPRSILGELRRIEKQVAAQWNNKTVAGISGDAKALLSEWGELVRTNASQARTIAGQVGSEARNFALLNYADRRNIDTWLSVVFPYHYWYTRTYGNWAKRTVMEPSVLAAYGRYRNTLNTMHAALPDYWKQQLSTDDLGISLDTPLMFNLEATLSPLNGILGSDFRDENRARANLFGVEGVGALAQDIGAFGPTVWAPITWALAASSFNKDPEAAMAWANGYLGSGFRAVRSVSALMNEIAPGMTPPGGLNVDPQMFITNMASGGGVSVSSLTEWERQRVAKTLTSYIDNAPQGVDPEDWKAQVAEAAYLQKGELWDKAVQESMASQAPGVIASYLFGVGFRARPQAEAEFTQIYADLKALRNKRDDMTNEQYVDEMQRLRERHPMFDLLMLSRANGEERDDAWVWEAASRVGVANSAMWESAGVSQAALDQFYKLKTTDGMDPTLRDELLRGASALNAQLRPRTNAEIRRQLDAKREYVELMATLQAKYGSATFVTEAEYYRVRDTQGPEAAQAWLDGLEPASRGVLTSMWNERTDALTSDPLTARYYTDPERYRSYLIGQFYDSQDPQTVELARAYAQLKTQDYSAARLLLDEHPELKPYWDAQGAFFDALPTTVQTWVNGLPAVEQMELREDSRPIGQLATQLETYAQDERAKFTKRRGDGAPDAMNVAAPLPGEAVPTGPAPGQSITDYYLQLAQQTRDDTVARDTYLSTKNRAGYNDMWLQPLVDQYGGAAAIGMLKAPLTQTWPTTATGDAGLLAFVGKGESFRAGLMQYVSTHDDLAWTRAVGYVRSMSDAQIDALVRRYPQMADLRLVRSQAQKYDTASLAALNDVLGMTVTIYEDGYVSIGRQSAKPTSGSGGGSGGSNGYQRGYQYGDTTAGGGAPVINQQAVQALTADVQALQKYFAFTTNNPTETNFDYMNDWLTHLSAPTLNTAAQNVGQALNQMSREDIVRYSNEIGQYLNALLKPQADGAPDLDYQNDFLTRLPDGLRASVEQLGYAVSETWGHQTRATMGAGGVAGLPNVRSSSDLNKYIAGESERLWPGIGALWDTYSQTALFKGLEAAQAFWDANPQLAEFDNWRDELKARWSAASGGAGEAAFIKAIGGNTSGGQSGGAGSGGSRRAAAPPDSAPLDPAMAEAVTWLDTYNTLRASDPSLAVALADYFDAPPNSPYRTALLQANKKLLEWLQKHGAVDALERGYAAWREQTAPNTAPRTYGTNDTARLRSLRVYKQRPTAAGLKS